MRLHLPCSLRKSLLSCLVAAAASTYSCGTVWATSEPAPQNLVFGGATLTWNTDTANKVFTNAAGEAASFATGDNVSFASDATISLGEDISAGQINIASGADVVIELNDNGLNFDTLSLLGGSLDVGNSLNVSSGETLAVGSNDSVIKSSLVLEDDARLSVDYSGSGSATSLNDSVLVLQGGNMLQLSGCGNGDGKTYTLLTGVSELRDSQGNTISLGEGNNAISNYFDTTQPGTGFWANGTLVLTNEGKLQLVRHGQSVKSTAIITTRQDNAADYQYYERVMFENIEHTVSTGYYSQGGAIYGSDDVSFSNNGSVKFNKNSVIHTQWALGGAIATRGGNISLNDNGSVEFIENLVSSPYHASGGAIDGKTISLNNNGSLLFSGNRAVSYQYTGTGAGGAIYGTNVTLSNNGHLEFSNNTVQSQNHGSSGGAIFASNITLSGNNEVRFSGNAVYAEKSEGNWEAAEGGAIIALSSIILSGNKTVEFCKNKAYAETVYRAEAYGGAISGRASSTIALNDNGVVSFRGNEVTAHDTYHSSAYGFGGAIYGESSSNISLNNNKLVEFKENINTTSAHWSAAYSYGGAIYGGSSSNMTLSNNGTISFKGNTVTSFPTSDLGLAYAYGGAVYGAGNITLSNNGCVEFCRNKASSTSAMGGAIYTVGDLSIQNNAFVLFEKNAEINNGTYHLRSIYASRGISISAAAGKSVEFRDSAYISSTVNLNADYTDAEGKAHKQQGDILFTGKYTETHLNEVLAAAGENRKATEQEIVNSRTSEVNAMTHLYGGRLRVEDEAVYKGRGITAHAGSESAVLVKDAVLNHAGYELQFLEGSKLEVLGESVIYGDVLVSSTATASFSSLTRLEGSLTLASGSTLLLDGEFTLDGTLTLGTGLTLGGNVLELLNQLQYGQSLTLVSGLDSLTVQSLNAKSTSEYSAFATDQELRAADYFSNLSPNMVLNYNGEVGSLSVSRIIPEPTTATLSLLALTALMSRRRRK